MTGSPTQVRDWVPRMTDDRRLTTDAYQTSKRSVVGRLGRSERRLGKPCGLFGGIFFPPLSTYSYEPNQPSSLELLPNSYRVLTCSTSSVHTVFGTWRTNTDTQSTRQRTSYVRYEMMIDDASDNVVTDNSTTSIQ